MGTDTGLSPSSLFSSVRGRFICLEGVDGGGKSLFCSKIESFLKAEGVEVIVTREPGGTPFADQLAQLLLHYKEEKESIMPDTELLLFFASRCQHINNLILPSLRQGVWVVSDRFTPSSYAYQGDGRGLGWDKVAALEKYLPELTPDLVLIFDLPPDLSSERLATKESDRFESLTANGHEFIRKVRESYLKYAKIHSECHVIDASPPPDQVWQQIRQHLIPLLKA